MYVACATAVVLNSEDSEKAKAHRPFSTFYESLTHFPMGFLLIFKGCVSYTNYEIERLAAFERINLNKCFFVLA